MFPYFGQFWIKAILCNLNCERSVLITIVLYKSEKHFVRDNVLFAHHKIVSKSGKINIQNES